ncbi:hypothetical protein [Candidatus Phytoplasma meliae]|uniref:Uncharacterized protein n=1 Tax=Candidatus Phytoplasma meliae TaxID=1848402 RepID=A0ABS5CXT9_9MOLU|nr:hypothetical protein [Candidatus Phytoplasma meliae]MBP5835793.1 hypothetical protein [Candidatus Phytoplasma meliae]MBP5836196.1 hypothetical protein [Candidatus Phytoplasma meliae]
MNFIKIKNTLKNPIIFISIITLSTGALFGGIFAISQYHKTKTVTETTVNLAPRQDIIKIDNGETNSKKLLVPKDAILFDNTKETKEIKHQATITNLSPTEQLHLKIGNHEIEIKNDNAILKEQVNKLLNIKYYYNQNGTETEYNNSKQPKMNPGEAKDVIIKITLKEEELSGFSEADLNTFRTNWKKNTVKINIPIELVE